MSGFGANEWLVDEMYEKYQKDPDSVDKVWWDFFGKGPRQGSARSEARPARAVRATAPGVRPAP